MTRCLGNTEYPFVGAVLLFHTPHTTHFSPPPPPRHGQHCGEGFFPFVPAIFLTEDRQSPLSTFPTCVGAHSLYHRLTCVHLLSQGSIPGWTHHSPRAVARAFLFLLLSKALMLI